ncbi:MarR family transcriptional regulator [Nonomuraea typhae]|uniref:MarR family transcriptional regulator n=1 Tax=Nonomuraea typhae TaxID=2603600 RepID=UPI001FE7DC45|nr:MarR family transcriptional regulator [Nonomuraea typhae]
MLAKLPPMMGKVLACLYATDSGSLTSADLAQQLHVSPASISKAVQYLERQALIRRERDPRQRRDRYVIDDDVWYRALLASARVGMGLAEIVEQGASVLGAATPGGARLQGASRFLEHVNQDLVRSANLWRKIHLLRRIESENSPRGRSPLAWLPLLCGTV